MTFKEYVDKLGLAAYTKRDAKIISHYLNEINLGRMDIFSAMYRTLGDISGRNYHPEREQRGLTNV